MWVTLAAVALVSAWGLFESGYLYVTADLLVFTTKASLALTAAVATVVGATWAAIKWLTWRRRLLGGRR